jgi:putative ABC transport system permease protein
MPEWRRHVMRAVGNGPYDPSQISEIADELAADLDDRYHALLADGASPDDAERAVLAQLTDGTLRVELARVLGRIPPPVELGSPVRARFWEAGWRDVRFGIRQLRRSPGFTIAALLCLTLGIGANSALFEVLDAVRLRTLPVTDPHNLAAIRLIAMPGRVGHFRGAADLTSRLFDSIRADHQGFQDIAGWSVVAVNLHRTGGGPDGRALLAGGNLFSVLGVSADQGRLLTPGDDRRGCASPPAVVSDAYWRTEMNAAASPIGDHIWVNHHAFDVVGVGAASFFGLEVGQRVDIMLPLCAQPLIEPDDALADNPLGWWLGAVGRLAPGWTIDRVSEHLTAMSPAVMQATMPAPYNAGERKEYARNTLGAVPMASGYSHLRSTYDQSLWLLLGIAGLVLLIACANLANLILARAAARDSEIAVRLALGASRGRLVRQLLSENVVLAAGGATAGAALASILSRALVPMLGGRHERIFVDLHMDWRVLAFTAALALLTCLLFGLSPALQSSRVPPAEVMKAAGRSVVARRSGARMRRALIATQVALSLVLVMSSLLFVRTFRNLLDVDPGFNPDGVVVASVNFSDVHVPAARRLIYKQQMTSLVRALPDVDSAARSSFAPVNGGEWNEMIDIPSTRTSKALAWVDAVGPGYFGVLQNRLLAGRDFADQDRAGSPAVAIISRTFATKLFQDPAPLGKTFGVVQYGDKPDAVYEVIGVAEDLKYTDLRSEFEPIVYFADAQLQSQGNATTLLVRSRTSSAALAAALRPALERLSPDIDVRISQLREDEADGLVRERLMAMLAGFFGILAVVLAAIGLYGIIAYTVAQRTSEIGIRMALGAGAVRIFRLVLADVAGTLGVGIMAGIALTVGVAPIAQSLLFGLRPTDLSTLAAAIAAIAMVAVLSSLLPAMRAARLDPVKALADR